LGAVGSLLVLEEVVSSMKSFLVALARQNGAFVHLRPMYFAFMAFQAAFVAERSTIAGSEVADIGTKVLVLMSPAVCEYDFPSKRKANYLRAAFVENTCCSGHPRKLHLRGTLSSEGVASVV
jgi:hypothetical protein